MKRNWDAHELEEYFTLSSEELQLTLSHKPDSSRLGYAVLLKVFEYQGRFPQNRNEVTGSIISFVAAQIGAELATFAEYSWQGRTIERHRAEIRELSSLY